MIPYARHHVSRADLRAVRRVLVSDWLAQGPEVGRFEAALARTTGAREAVGVSSGTAALHLALQALGVGPGDEVIVPSLTFVATANAVALCGARPVFADVDARDLCLDPEALPARASERTVGAIAMHYAGQPAKMARLREAIAGDLFLLEDACHALGARDGGEPAGSLGDAACFSFHPAKHVTTGEGGAITCSRSQLVARARRAREHGIERKAERFEGLGLPDRLRAEQEGGWVYEMHELAPNYRMPEASAALGRSQLKRLPEQLARRRQIVAHYRSALQDCDVFELPEERLGTSSAWHLFVLRLHLERLRVGRAEIFRELRAGGIGVQVHYIPVHLQPFYRRRFGTRYGDLPVCEAEYLRLLSIPLHANLTHREIETVIERLKDVARRYRR